MLHASRLAESLVAPMSTSSTSVRVSVKVASALELSALVAEALGALPPTMLSGPYHPGTQISLKYNFLQI